MRPTVTGIAVLGSGGIASEHVLALSTTAGARVTAVFGSDIDRAAATAALAPGARASVDLEEILADEDTHGVIVCGRTPEHSGRALAALAAGKHVIVEKPPALRLADFDAMIAAAGRQRLMVGQTVRFQPAIAAMAEQVHSGRIGRPRVLHLNWYVGHVWPGAWRSWQLDTTRSGGHLVHNGMHPIDLAVWLLGARPVRVFARGWCTHAPDMSTPDSFHLTIRFDNGALALVEVSYGLPAGDVLRRTVVMGTDGTLRHHTGEDAMPSGPLPAAYASVDGALRREAAHIVEVVAERTEPLVDLGDSRAALATAIAAQRSLERGRPVLVEEVEHDG